MGREEFHELTGEPYLGSVHYGPPLGWLKPMLFPRQGKRTLKDKIFMERHVNAKGREWYRPRKWPNMPGHLIYKFWRKHRHRGCKYGFHLDKADIIELDASIRRAECCSCKTLVRAKKPRPADEAEAQRWTKSNAESLKTHEEIAAYHEGRGPCPWCTPPEGQDHAENCWERDDIAEELPDPE